MKPALKQLEPPPFTDHWVAVDRNELARLLQMPGKEMFDDDLLHAITRVEAWHQRHIAIWYHQEMRAIKTIGTGHLVLDDDCLLPVGWSFQQRLRQSRAHSLVLLGYTVGPETDAHAKRLWDEEKFDEAFLVKSYGAALAEELRSRHVRVLRDWASKQNLSILPPEGPGYNDWPTHNITGFYACLEVRGGALFQERIKLLPEGSLAPANSMLLAFGLGAHSGPGRIRRHEYVPCSNCTLNPCAFRRKSYPSNRILHG
jgi:hypothetical protein